jgi:hypothetical protein
MKLTQVVQPQRPRMTFRQANRFDGPCSHGTPPCTDRTDLSVPTPRCCVAMHVEMLKVIAPILDKAGVRWWIDYGMLLGYMVNQGFYWNDRDIDIGVLAEDREKVKRIGEQLKRSHRWLATYVPQNLGRPWKYSDCLKISSSFRNRTALDITFWEQNDGVLDRKTWASVDKYKGRTTPVDWIFPLSRGQWEGVEVPVPKEAERLVEYRYGPNWKNLPASRTSGEFRENENGGSAELITTRPPISGMKQNQYGRTKDACEVTDEEGLVLRNYAARATDPIVEIGAYKGRSMCFLADGSNEGNKVPVFSVDLWEEGSGYALTRDGRKIPRPYARPSTRRLYEDARKQYGHGLVKPIRGDSATVAQSFNLPVGMLFVDGDHTEKGVMADLEAWMPKVTPDGIIAFHDMNAPGVLKAIEKYLPGWKQLERERLVAIYQREDAMRFLDAKKPLAIESKLGAAPKENKAAPTETETQFASAAAKEAAEAAGLTVRDFEGHTPSGAKGFTKADVEAMTEVRGN